jgi:hypothetical protein
VDFSLVVGVPGESLLVESEGSGLSAKPQGKQLVISDIAVNS